MRKKIYEFFFFFQAEDGIRDRNVTGVQTCALPIYNALLAVQEHIAEVLLAWEGAQEGELSQPVFTRHSACGAVLTGVVFHGEPGPMLGIEFRERKRLVGQFVADLFAPSAMPSFNNALGLTILDLRVQ